MDTSGERHRGVLTGDDMAGWEAHIEAPLTYDYGRYTACKAGVWSQGPVMLQQLALLKGFDLDGADPTGAEFIHTVVECSKLAFADREKFYGDPDFAEVPIETLLSDAYNDERRKLVHHTASMELRPGSVEGFGSIVKLKTGAKIVAGMGAGEPTVGRMGEVVGDTVHFDIVDQAGNMVSSTPSGGWLQSSPVIPGARLLPRHARRRCSGSRKAIRRRWRPASGRAPRCRRPWRCATASRIWPGARPAATSRTSGPRNCSCGTCIAA